MENNIAYVLLSEEQLRNKVKELGLPYLGIETDYAESDLGQLSTRIEAFLETI